MKSPIHSRSARATLIGLLALAAFACAAPDTVKAPSSGRVDLLPLADYPQIVATQGLHEWLVFSPPSVVPGGEEKPMSVSVPFRSTYDRQPVNLQYRFIFFDDRGRPLETSPGYRFIHAEPRVQSFLEGNAIQSGAADWRLEIRAAR